MKKIKLCIITSAILLIGCSGNPAGSVSTQTAVPEASTQAAYPATDQGYPSIDLGYPNVSGDPNMTNQMVPTMLPLEMIAGTGAVEGQLLLNGVPLPGINLYLANFIKDADGKEYVASVSIQRSPFAVTDSNGNFRFINVPADRYGLVIEDATQSFILMPPNGDGDLIAEVMDQKTYDLGKLDYQELPIHP